MVQSKYVTPCLACNVPALMGAAFSIAGRHVMASTVMTHPQGVFQPRAPLAQPAWSCHFWTGCLHCAAECSPVCPICAQQSLREWSPELVFALPASQTLGFDSSVTANRLIQTVRRLYLSAGSDRVRCSECAMRLCFIHPKHRLVQCCRPIDTFASSPTACKLRNKYHVS